MSTTREPRSVVLVGTAVLVALLGACDRGQVTAPAIWPSATGLLAQSSPKLLSVARCAQSAGGFTTAFTHPYFFPDVLGYQAVLEGEEDGESEQVQITVLAQTRDVGGVTTRVIEEREWVDGTLVEVSWNYYAQANDGSICYFGEDVDIYENGNIVHTGAWCAVGGNQPGIFLPVELQPGTKFQMEIAPDAMDVGTIVGIGPVTVPFSRFEETIRVREFNPLDGDKGFKVFVNGVGLVVDGPVELTAVNQTNGIPQQPVLTGQVCGS